MSQLPPDSSNSSSESNDGIRQRADNTSMSGGMQAAQGDGNVQIQGDNNSVFNYFQNLFLGKQESSVSRPRNEQLLLAQVKQEVASRLKQSLHNAILINLCKEEQPEQVQPPLAAEIKIGSKPGQKLAENTTILQVFDKEEINGRLLILGEPGAGKTTTLLELAKDLVERAEHQLSYPMPVLLNLSSWKDPHKSIVDWLTEELKSRYDVRRDIGKKWIENKQLLPLLDGLDEVKPDYQESCIKAINQWAAGINRSLYIVVCSRIEEYNSFEIVLEFNQSILLKTLTEKQIKQYLYDVNRRELWLMLQQDSQLSMLMQTPLWLSITVLSYEELSLSQWREIASTEKRLELLLDNYIKRMLSRSLKSVVYTGRRQPDIKQTKHWLAFLAKQLQQESHIEFLIEKIQPFYLAKDSEIIMYFFADVLLNILAGHPTYGLGKKLLRTLKFTSKGESAYQFIINGFPTFLRDYIEILDLLVRSLVYYFRSHSKETLMRRITNLLLMKIDFTKKEINKVIDKIEAFDSIKWSFRKINFIKNLSALIFLGFISGLIFGKYSFSSSLFINICFGFLYGLLISFYKSLDATLHTSDVSSRKLPNSAIRGSLINSLIIGLVFGLAFWFLIGIVTGFLLTLSFHVKNGLVLGVGIGLFIGLFNLMRLALNNGFMNFAKHYILRIILFQGGYTPLRYSKFLNYCSERLLLQRVGGRYRFIHKLLQDHFANMEIK